MFRNITCGWLVLCCLTAFSQAAIFFSMESVTSVPNLPGYTSFTISVQSTVAGEQIQGVDFAGDGSNDPTTGKGFFGRMNQVGPPLINTTFMDNNNLIPLLNPGKTSAEDSQFLITTTQANVAVPSGFAEEGPNILQGIWAWTEPQGTSVTFARIVTNGPITYRGSFSLKTPQGIVDTPVITGGWCFADCGPQFDSVIIDNVDANNPGFVEYVWPELGAGGTFSSGIQFDGNPSRIITPATMDPVQRKFHWDTVGMPLGSYRWFVSASDDTGIRNRTITVNITVPEPSTFAALATAAVTAGICLRGRRTSL